ncbi:MAG: type I polyketide synthase, partial [Candidatus Promineifilaceae bacterium]
ALARYLAGNKPPQKAISAAHNRHNNEPIAVIGMGCRLPGAPDCESFWRLLQEGVDAIAKVPCDRWDAKGYADRDFTAAEIQPAGYGGFLDKVDQFDPQFFGISPREAASMDPQQRLLLEVSWEALENAGLAAETLDGTQTGVFIGISGSDYGRLQFEQSSSISSYAGTGNAVSIAANRLSYLMDLRGPSVAVDTACSSSLFALHQACQSLRQAECDVAITGGVNLIIDPMISIIFSQAGMLAADGRCKTFSADADGYVRGEGCGIIVLKRLSAAIADGDNIIALIKGSAVNQDGRSNGLTAPNGPAQQAVINSALQNAGVPPAWIDYVETHGTGTSLGDPIEVNALKEVLMNGRGPEQPCRIGSVKTNIGHLEAAAGIAGLIKVVLAMQHKEIPAHLHFAQLNPRILIEDTPISIPVKRRLWTKEKYPRLAGISSFGFGGTNAHIIVEEAPEPAPVVAAVERPVHLLTLSAKSEGALKALTERYEGYLAANPEAVLGDVCYTANTGRSHFSHRLAIVAKSCEELRTRLGAFASGKVPSGVATGHNVETERLKTAFLFTGQGSQYAAMGRQLYETQPVFRQTLERCNAILKSDLKISLIDVLYPE